MRKLSVLILAILYISISTGATVHVHYCMGKLAGWGFGQDDSKTCGKCGMPKHEKDNGCCKDKHKFIKSNTDQKITESAFQSIQLKAFFLPSSLFDISNIDFHSVTDEIPDAHAPPQTYGVAVYIRNCVFLI